MLSTARSVNKIVYSNGAAVAHRRDAAGQATAVDKKTHCFFSSGFCYLECIVPFAQRLSQNVIGISLQQMRNETHKTIDFNIVRILSGTQALSSCAFASPSPVCRRFECNGLGRSKSFAVSDIFFSTSWSIDARIDCCHRHSPYPHNPVDIVVLSVAPNNRCDLFHALWWRCEMQIQW